MTHYEIDPEIRARFAHLSPSRYDAVDATVRTPVVAGQFTADASAAIRSRPLVVDDPAPPPPAVEAPVRAPRAVTARAPAPPKPKPEKAAKPPKPQPAPVVRNRGIFYDSRAEHNAAIAAAMRARVAQAVAMYPAHSTAEIAAALKITRQKACMYLRHAGVAVKGGRPWIPRKCSHDGCEAYAVCKGGCMVHYERNKGRAKR